MDVRVHGLRKTYPSPGESLVVLDRLDLELESGEAIAITGPSGCGKSTLLHILGTLETPDSGSVRLGGVDPFALAERELARFRNHHIGFVFQDHYLLPQCTLLENVLVPSLVDAGHEGDAEADALDLLERVGLRERAGHRPAELSGGERQRAAIARALIQAPGILLCDEPTGNLDLETAERVGDLFVELYQELETTVIVVTHSLELAERFSRRLALKGHRLEPAVE